MKKNNFNSRMLDALASDELKVRLERSSRGYQVIGGAVLSKTKRLHAYENVKFEESDLRGLSINEKNFIRENGYKNYYDQTTYDYTANAHKTERYYIFISRSLTTGKPTIYAYEKKQWLDLSGQFFKVMGSSQKGWNYEYWLVFNNYDYNDRGRAFSRFNAEYRFSKILSNITL